MVKLAAFIVLASLFSLSIALELRVDAGSPRCVSESFEAGSSVRATFLSRDGTRLHVVVRRGRRIIATGKNGQIIPFFVPAYGARFKRRTVKVEYRFCVRVRQATTVRFVLAATKKGNLLRDAVSRLIHNMDVMKEAEAETSDAVNFMQYLVLLKSILAVIVLVIVICVQHTDAIYKFLRDFQEKKVL